MYVEDFPHTYWSVESGDPVPGYQARPGAIDGLGGWLDTVGHPPAAVLMVNGGPAVLLAATGGVVGLGDHAVLTLDGVHPTRPAARGLVARLQHRAAPRLDADHHGRHPEVDPPRAEQLIPGAVTMPRHRRRNDWPLTLGIMLLAAVLAGLVVLLLHHQLGAADRALDVGVRPVEPTPAITYTGPITTGPTPTPPPDPGR